MKKIAVLLTLAILALSTTYGLAQNKKDKEEKPPVFNYVIEDSPMDQAQAQPDSQKIFYYNYLVPDFYFHRPKKVLDTTYEFFCYDVRDTPMTFIYDYDSVYYYSLYKSYTDSAHTYIDKDGEKQFIPVASIIKRYDRIGKNKWMSIEYAGNKYSELRALKNEITNIDTEKSYNDNGDNVSQQIYKHYKLRKK